MSVGQAISKSHLDLKPLVSESNHQLDIFDVDYTRLLPAKRKLTTFICQIHDPEVSALDLQKMMEAGADVFKVRMYLFNMKHEKELLRKFEMAQKNCCKKNNMKDWPVAICVELKTCSIKSGFLDKNKIHVYMKLGSHVKLSCNKQLYNKCNSKQIFIDSLYLTKNVLPGNLVSINEDEVILKCTKYIDEFTVQCEVVKDGKLSNFCPVNLKGATYHEPFLTEKDYEILEFVVENKIDLIMISYSRSILCLRAIKEWLKNKPHKPMIICGVATASGLEEFEEIAKEADALIISRDFLEFELDETKRGHMPRIQKWMAAVCQKAGKQFFISGGIFEQALITGIPTQSEVFDVSNSLFEGASGFTIKKCLDPDLIVEALLTLDSICKTVEPMVNPTRNFWKLLEMNDVPVNAAKAAALSCLTMALVCDAKAIVIPTVSGATVKLILSLRPNCTVLTVSSSNRVKKQLSMFGNVIPLMYKGSPNCTSFQEVIRSRIKYAEEFAVHKSLMKYGDIYISLQRNDDTSAFCDTIRAWKVLLVTKSNIECPSKTAFYKTEQYLQIPDPMSDYKVKTIHKAGSKKQSSRNYGQKA